VAHHIDLWFEDIGKMPFFKDIWEQGKMVVIWIRGYQVFAAKLGNLTPKSFLHPGESGLCYFKSYLHPRANETSLPRDISTRRSATGQSLEPATTEKLVYIIKLHLLKHQNGGINWQC
jgi:hypothetical protein